MVGLGAYLVTTVLMVAPLRYLQRRWPLPFGAVTVHVGLLAVLGSAVAQFEQRLAVAAVLTAGFLVDALLYRLTRRDADDRVRAVVLAVGIPLLLWPAQLAGVAATHGIAWSAELAVGVVLLTSGLSLALTTLTGADCVSDTDPGHDTTADAGAAGPRATRETVQRGEPAPSRTAAVGGRLP